MEKIKLIHNPNAGDGSYSRKELIAMVESAGYECDYTSSKKDGWKEIKPHTDMIVIAGGDGTVRKLAKAFFKDDSLDSSIPVGLLNMGTANNLIRALRIKGEPGELIEKYKKEQVKKFDAGIVKGLAEPAFFLESCGIGLFPELMKVMKDVDMHDMDTALKFLLELIPGIPAEYCEIEMDGKKTEGNFIMAEVMNSPWMGPGLHMNALSDPGDNKLELVLIAESEREQLAQFISGKLTDGSGAFNHHPAQGNSISIKTSASLFHTDDELIKLKKNDRIQIELREGFMSFMI